MKQTTTTTTTANNLRRLALRTLAALSVAPILFSVSWHGPEDNQICADASAAECQTPGPPAVNQHEADAGTRDGGDEAARMNWTIGAAHREDRGQVQAGEEAVNVDVTTAKTVTARAGRRGVTVLLVAGPILGSLSAAAARLDRSASGAASRFQEVRVKGPRMWLELRGAAGHGQAFVTDLREGRGRRPIPLPAPKPLELGFSDLQAKSEGRLMQVGIADAESSLASLKPGSSAD